MSRRVLALEVALYSVSIELVPQNNTFLELASSQSEVSRLLNENSRTHEFAGVDFWNSRVHRARTAELTTSQNDDS